MLCTNKIRVIYFCSKKFIFYFLRGSTASLAHAPIDAMKKLTTSFNTCKSENHCLFRTFQNRTKAYPRV